MKAKKTYSIVALLTKLFQYKQLWVSEIPDKFHIGHPNSVLRDAVWKIEQNLESKNDKAVHNEFFLRATTHVWTRVKIGKGHYAGIDIYTEATQGGTWDDFVAEHEGKITYEQLKDILNHYYMSITVTEYKGDWLFKHIVNSTEITFDNETIKSIIKNPFITLDDLINYKGKITLV